MHIKNITALRKWHDSGEFKKWHKGNWSPSCAAANHVRWEDTDQIAFYQMQNQIPGLSKSLDRTGSWMSDLLEMAEYLQSIGQSLNLLYLDDQHRFAVISSADTEEAYTLPCRFLEIEEYKDYSDCAPDQMCSNAGETASSIIPIGQGFYSVTDVKKDIRGKEEKLKFSHSKNVIILCDSWYMKENLVSIVEEYENLALIGNARSDSVIYDLASAPTGHRGRPAKHGRRLSIEDDLYSTLCACEV